MTSPGSPASPTLPPPPSGVTVRLYNPGFGDYVLLAFPTGGAKACYLLIDCGVHCGYPEDKEKIQRLARDVRAATGRHLDVAVATHGHPDRRSGFEQARAVFDDITIDQLWLPWTEDPTDPVARQLKQLYARRRKALEAAIRLASEGRQPWAEALQRPRDFEQEEKFPALEDLGAKSTEKQYRRPGEAPLALPGVPGVKVHVLGPPRAVEGLRIWQKQRERHPGLTDLDELDGFALAALAAAGTDSLEEEEGQLFRQSCPFDRSLMISPQEAEKHPEYGGFFRTFYGFAHQRGHGPAWRRLDTSWLSAAERLALDLNRRTNNSLVLAFELTETQPPKILLFAAPAQAGNRPSWQSLSGPGEGSDKSEVVTVPDILRRTVLYKVGHHGSRNAFPSHKGLGLMERADLVAMMPVDDKWAQQMGWEHPAGKIMEGLKTKTKSRIIRTEEIPPGDQTPPNPDEASDTEWRTFLERLDWDRSPDKLWIQFTVPG